MAIPRSLDYPEHTPSKYRFLISPETEHFLGDKRGATERLYKAAINSYNNNYPLSKIDVPNIDKTKVKPATYMSKLRDACRGKIEIVDQINKRNILI